LSIYHLHIPRTSGAYIRNNILPDLISKDIEHFASNRSIIDVDQISRSKLVIGHFGRMPLKYMDSPKVFCLLRDPVERYISYFKYTTGFVTGQEKAEENLEQWLYKDQSKVQGNLQSKFLTGSTDVSLFNSYIKDSQDPFIDNLWHLQDYSLDIDKIKESMSEMNVYTMENYDKFKFDFSEEIKKQFGFNAFKHSDKANESPAVRVEINESHKKVIKDLNQVDCEIYDYVRKTEKR
jgi:hypothetical protein